MKPPKNVCHEESMADYILLNDNISIIYKKISGNLQEGKHRNSNSSTGISSLVVLCEIIFAIFSKLLRHHYLHLKF